MQPGDTVNKGLKSRMQRREFAERKEWVPVARLEDIPAVGDTKAVGAGRAPGKMGLSGWEDGAEYIWCLVRGEDSVAEGETEPTETVFAIDGSCRTCKFPLTAGELSTMAGRQVFSCKCCGTTFALDNGEVLEFLPKKNPLQWATSLRVGGTEPMPTASLPTRISKAGRVYLRLPDNTIQS